MKNIIFLGIVFLLFSSNAKAEDQIYKRITTLTPVSEANQLISNSSNGEFVEIVAGENPGEDYLKAQLPSVDR